MERRVVITAMSAITPIGYGKDRIVSSLLNGVSGVRPLREEEFLSPFIHCKVYGTVEDPIAYDFTRNQRKTMGPVAYYACQVAKEVLEQSGLKDDFIRSGRLGVAFGSIHGSPTVQRNIYRIFFGARDKIAIKEIGAV
ncbi:MAG TPA: beta-ketoacyl synthase N-terminal-like domain-containing protein, partial [Smithellaceae bacterium]|nr:beta-ketoacyl synthase N-terminal-like domain-containing protein [Smithellaceae bacterium]